MSWEELQEYSELRTKLDDCNKIINRMHKRIIYLEEKLTKVSNECSEYEQALLVIKHTRPVKLVASPPLYECVDTAANARIIAGEILAKFNPELEG